MNPIGDRMKARKTNPPQKKPSRKVQANKAASIPADERLNLWEHIFSKAKWGVAVSSQDGKTLAMMNPEFANMHGFTVEELTGKPLIDIYAPQARPALAGHIRIANENELYTFESLHTRKDGTTFPVQIDVTAVRDENDEFLYRVVNCQDITQRVLNEDKLNQLGHILESTLNEIFLFDADTFRFTLVN